MRKLAWLFALVLLALCAPAAGEAPLRMSYQGVLMDGAGVVAQDGLYALTFSLYETQEGGMPIWEESQDAMVRGGIFDVILGAVTPLDPPFDVPYWLGIAVEGEAELEPRVELTSTPYAFQALGVPDSSLAGGKIAAGQVVRSIGGLTDDVLLWPGQNVNFNFDYLANSLTISAMPAEGTVSGDGLEGQVAFWDPSGAIAGDDFLFWNIAEKRLGIGTPNPNARLRVESGAEDFTAVFASTATAGNPQVVRANYLGTSHIDARGVYGRSNPDGGFGVGGEFEGGWKGVIATANGGDHDYHVYGVHATATGTADCASGMCRYGVYGEASGPDGWNTRFYGVYGEASSENAWPNYGVYGNSQGFNGGRIGVCGVAGGQGCGSKIGVLGRIDNGKPDSCYAVYALGHLFYSGDLIHYSDERLKENVEPISGALDAVMRLEPVTFRYRTGDPRFTHMNLAGGRHYGLVAQQLETVLPELVREVHQPPIYPDDGAGAGKEAPGAAPVPLLPAASFKGITSIELVPILVQAIREQQETIERLARRVEALEGR